jgi:hypothetical protein
MNAYKDYKTSPVEYARSLHDRLIKLRSFFVRGEPFDSNVDKIVTLFSTVSLGFPDKGGIASSAYGTAGNDNQRAGPFSENKGKLAGNFSE